MTKDTVSNKDLYTEILKIHEKIDTIIEKRINPLERTMDRLLLYAGIIGVITSLFIDGVKSYITEKIKGG